MKWVEGLQRPLPSLSQGDVKGIANKIVEALRGVRDLLIRPAYLTLAITGASIVLLASVLLPNYPLLLFVLDSDLLSVGTKARFVTDLIAAFFTDTPWYKILVTLAVSLLSGANISLIIGSLRKSHALQRGGTTMGALGVISGILGVGCSSCGSVILVSAAGISSSLLGILPLKGLELSILSVILLVVSCMTLGGLLRAGCACEKK